MRKFLIVIIAVVAAFGCSKKTHPVKVFVSPDYKPAEIEKVAVLPFASTLHHSEDPDGRAPAIMDQLFREELDTRDDYSFLSPRSVIYALESAGLSEDLEAFLDDVSKNRGVNEEFLEKCESALQAQALMFGVVDLWNQDEVDYRETQATPTTTVGATIKMLSLKDGKLLFEASDEDFLEGVESNAESRGTMTSGLGAVRSDPGANLYEAPDPEQVASKVVRALVSSIPRR